MEFHSGSTIKRKALLKKEIVTMDVAKDALITEIFNLFKNDITMHGLRDQLGNFAT